MAPGLLAVSILTASAQVRVAPLTFRPAPSGAVGAQIGTLDHAGLTGSLISQTPPSLTASGHSAIGRRPDIAGPGSPHAAIQGPVPIKPTTTVSPAPARAGVVFLQAPAPAARAVAGLPRLTRIAGSKTPAPLWTGARVRPEPGWADPVHAERSAGIRIPGLNRAAPEQGPRRDGPPSASSQPEVRVPERSLVRRLKDTIAYGRIYLKGLTWYTFPRLIERWKELKDNLELQDTANSAVKDFRGFFVDHRILGTTGVYAPLGFRTASNGIVIKDALWMFDTYFPADAEARSALVRMIKRAADFNPNRRESQFRKKIFHALRYAAVLRPEFVAAFFDSQITRADEQVLIDYQRDRQQAVIDLFGEFTREIILELNDGKPRGKRLVGAILLGSYASSSAGPESDLDVHVVTEDGEAGDNDLFIAKMREKWKAAGIVKNPIHGFEYGLPISKRLIDRIHREPYLLFSPYPEIMEALRFVPSADADAQRTKLTAGGRVFQSVYGRLLHAVIAVYDALGRFR